LAIVSQGGMARMLEAPARIVRMRSFAATHQVRFSALYGRQSLSCTMWRIWGANLAFCCLHPIPTVRENYPNGSAPESGLLFLYYLDVLPPDRGARFTQYECPLGQLQILCCKRHQIFGHSRLSTVLCEPYAPFG
jgi:hypothetical protein